MLKSFLSLFLKSNCPICQRPSDRILCQYCFNNLQSCQLDNHQGIFCDDLPVFIWGSYSSYLKRAIASFKYDLHQEIGEVLGEFLAKAWINSGLYSRNQNITVVPIPLDKKKQKERGFNQADLIARRFCQITKYNLKSNLLNRIKKTDALFNLNPTQRKQEMKNAFSMGKDFETFKPNSSVLILDDIYTTGATVREAYKVLSSYRIKVKQILAIASTRNSSRKN